MRTIDVVASADLAEGKFQSAWEELVENDESLTTGGRTPFLGFHGLVVCEAFGEFSRDLSNEKPETTTKK